MVSRRGAIAGPPAAPRPLAAGLLLLALGIGTALARPEQVQLSVSEDEENSVLIFWMTKDSTEVSEVRYGTSPDSLDQEVSVRGNQERYRFRDYRSPYTHEVTLRGLSTNSTLYYYQVGDPRDGWSQVFSFYTRSQHPDADVRVFAFADQDMRGPSQKIIEAMSKRNYDFHYLIHGGDINYSDGRDPEVWDEYGELMQPLLSSLPSVYAMGNHEKERRNNKDDQTIDAYLYRFRHGEVGRQVDDAWWSVNMGPMHVILLSSEHHSQSEPWGCRGCTERQAEFLENDLKEAAKPANRKLRPWIVVVVHRPFYNAGRNGMWHLQKKMFEPIMERYRVNLVIEGHCHNYERTYPVFQDEIVNTGEGTYDNPYVQDVFSPKNGSQGQIHLIIGTGGAKSNGPCPRTDLTLGEIHWPGWGYGMFEANRRRLKFQYVDTDGKTLDEFMICSQKDCAAPPRLAGVQAGASTISPIVEGIRDTRSRTWVPGYWNEDGWHKGQWVYGPPGSALPEGPAQPQTMPVEAVERLDKAVTGVTDVVTQPHIPSPGSSAPAADERTAIDSELCPLDQLSHLCGALPFQDRQNCFRVTLQLQQVQHQQDERLAARTQPRQPNVAGQDDDANVSDWEDELQEVEMPVVRFDKAGYVVDGGHQHEILEMIAAHRNGSYSAMDDLVGMLTGASGSITSNTPALIGICAGAIVVLELAIIIGICICCRRRSANMKEQPLVSSNAISSSQPETPGCSGSNQNVKDSPHKAAGYHDDSVPPSKEIVALTADESSAPPPRM